MCAVSFVSDHYKEKWPYEKTWPTDLFPMVKITKMQWDEYQELKRKAAQYDKDTKQPDCIKPENDEWEKRVVDLLIKQGILIKPTIE
jgi:hypothetical protein